MTQSTIKNPNAESTTAAPSSRNTAPSSLCISATDGHEISIRIWQDDSAVKPKAILQILHGMAEHCDRYDAMAKQFAHNGYIVVAHDQRAHGHSTDKQGSQLGHYENATGWSRTISDVAEVADFATKKFSQLSLQPSSPLPLVLFGHSMGSYVALGALQSYPEMAQATVLSGSGFVQASTVKALTLIAKFERFRLGRQATSKVLNFLTFGAYNRPFVKDSDSEFNWLSRDHAEVEKYTSDPLCGFLCSTETWVQFGAGLQKIFSRSGFKKLPKNIPYYILSGTADPVGANGKGVQELAEQLALSDVKSVRKRLYLDGRHEMINEINRDEVLVDLQNWLDKKVEQITA